MTPWPAPHVRSGLRNWKRHGQGMWRIGIYHGIDGWSFWSIGVGRNAVLDGVLGGEIPLRRRRSRRARPHRREIRAAGGPTPG